MFELKLGKSVQLREGQRVVNGGPFTALLTLDDDDDDENDVISAALIHELEVGGGNPNVGVNRTTTTIPSKAERKRVKRVQMLQMSQHRKLWEKDIPLDLEHCRFTTDGRLFGCLNIETKELLMFESCDGSLISRIELADSSLPFSKDCLWMEPYRRDRWMLCYWNSHGIMDSVLLLLLVYDRRRRFQSFITVQTIDSIDFDIVLDRHSLLVREDDFVSLVDLKSIYRTIRKRLPSLSKEVYKNDMNDESEFENCLMINSSSSDDDSIYDGSLKTKDVDAKEDGSHGYYDSYHHRSSSSSLLFSEEKAEEQKERRLLDSLKNYCTHLYDCPPSADEHLFVFSPDGQQFAHCYVNSEMSPHPTLQTWRFLSDGVFGFQNWSRIAHIRGRVARMDWITDHLIGMAVVNELDQKLLVYSPQMLSVLYKFDFQKQCPRFAYLMPLNLEFSQGLFRLPSISIREESADLSSAKNPPPHSHGQLTPPNNGGGKQKLLMSDNNNHGSGTILLHNAHLILNQRWFRLLIQHLYRTSKIDSVSARLYHSGKHGRSNRKRRSKARMGDKNKHIPSVLCALISKFYFFP